MLQSTHLGEVVLLPDIFDNSATMALRELFLPKLVPCIMEHPPESLPDNVAPIFPELLRNITADERFFLCCARWEFNTNDSIDPEWAFYRATLDSTINQCMQSIVDRYNGPSESNLTVKDGCSLFKVLTVP
jgi:hypothetical protein